MKAIDVLKQNIYLIIFLKKSSSYTLCQYFHAAILLHYYVILIVPHPINTKLDQVPFLQLQPFSDRMSMSYK